MAVAEAIPVADGGKAGAHGRQAAEGFFDVGRVVFEMGAVLTGGTGAVGA